METLKKMKLDLIEFHRLCDETTPEDKLIGLVGIQLKYYGFVKRIPLPVRRKQFEENDRNKRFFKRSCYVCGNKSEVRHHIISLKQGGTNAKRNIVALCRYCHGRIHPWLKKSGI